MPSDTMRRLFPALMISMLLVALLPWAFSVLRTPPTSDLIWLYEAFTRLMNGQRLTDAIFEPNPPLSLFTYAVPYFLVQITDWSPTTSIFVYVTIMLASGAAVVKYTATRILPADYYAPWLITFTYVVSQTIMTVSMYGERDHLIGIVLVPFVLMQYALLKGKTIPVALQWSMFLVGALVILLKPHHGLIPFCMIVWRMAQRKDLSVIKDADFLSLSTMVLGYMALLFWGFGDYRTIIFPDVLALYLTDHIDDIGQQAFSLAIPGVLLGGAAYILRRHISDSALIMFLSACALASLVPYLVQGKGFFYHLFPAFGFFTPAFFLMMAAILQREIRSARMAFLLSSVSALCMAYAIFPPNMKLPTYAAYQEKPLTKIITENCHAVQDCSFFMFNDSMGIIHEISYVTGFIHASRFPSFWFLPKIVSKEQDGADTATILRLAYAARIAQDLEVYKPRTLIIGRFKNLYDDGRVFDFAAYWGVSSDFRAQWNAYAHTGTLDIANSDFHPVSASTDRDIVTYDIYRRID